VYLDAGIAVSAWRRKAIPSGQAERVVSFPPAGAFDFNARPWAASMKRALGRPCPVTTKKRRSA